MYELYISNGDEERLLLKTDFQQEFEKALHDLLYIRGGAYVDCKNDELWWVKRAKDEKGEYDLLGFLTIAEIAGFIPCK